MYTTNKKIPDVLKNIFLKIICFIFFSLIILDAVYADNINPNKKDKSDSKTEKNNYSTRIFMRSGRIIDCDIIEYHNKTYLNLFLKI